MKELYETPTVEFIEFDSEEVITMSGPFGDNDVSIDNTGWERERGGYDMKELYETPTVEFIEFDSEEVITMSGPFGDNDVSIDNTGWGA